MSIETPPATLRLHNIQALRGIAALLVTLSHLVIIEQKYSPDSLFGPLLELGMVGVDLFFVISGFIMVHVAWNFRRGLGAAGEFLFARAGRIYPLYWFVSLLILGIWIVQPNMVFSSVVAEPNLIKSFLLYPDTRPPLLAVGWTLVHEIFFYLVFALALLFRPKLILPFLVAWTLVLTIGIAMGLSNSSPLPAILFSPLSYEFLLGAIAAWVMKTTNAKHAKLALIAGIALSAAALIYTYVYHCGMPPTFGARALYFSLPAAFLIYGLSGLELRGHVMSRALSHLGDWSYSLYLTHILTLSLLGRIWQKTAQQGLWDNILILLLMPTIAVVVSYFCWRFVEKPMLDLLKKNRKTLFAANR